MAVPYPIVGASDPPAAGTRRYRSPRREQQARHTRARIIAAAARRFLEHGYAATTMRAVATDAGVALPTVELAFKTKARLLKAVIDTAIAGDDEPVPMLAREWATQAQSAAEPADFVAVFAQVLIDSAQRAAGLTLAALEAARIDEDIAVIATQLMAQRQVMATWLVDGLLQRSALRDNVDRAAAIDTVWTLMDPALFCRLTSDRRWSGTRFRRWFTDGTLRLLLPVHDQQATTSRSQEKR
jgi:AcrR family transcriptional regulator